MPALKYYDLTSGTYKYVTGGMSQAAADARYIKKTGDTMTGPLTLAAEAVGLNEPPTQRQALLIGNPSQYHSRVLTASITSDVAGNADFQFGSYPFSQPPHVTCTPVHATQILACVIVQCTTTRVYCQVRNTAGNGVASVQVYFIAIGWIP